jgi:hypothetical protein
MSAKLPTVNEPPGLPSGGGGAGVGTGVAVGFGAGVASGTDVGAGAGVRAGAVAVAVGTGVPAGAETAGGAEVMVGVGAVEVQAKNSMANPPITKDLALVICLIPPLLNRPQQRPTATARAGSRDDCSQL